MKPGMFLDGKAIGHSGDIIADCSLQPTSGNPLLDVVRKYGWFEMIAIEQVCNDLFSLHLHSYHAIEAVQFVIKEVL